ncbi:hypothetical protein K9M79_00820 [Candidatus Woesearchaeota archaeon]|nr:hypothetical protein [Candidatus Woesearchaeota archaeon]
MDDDNANSMNLEMVLSESRQVGEGILAKIEKQISVLPSKLQDFLVGEEQNEVFESISHPSLDVIGYDDLKEQAKSIFERTQAIIREKGYRFIPSLYTGREHKECGSSGYEFYEEKMPDVPIPIVKSRLNMLKDYDQPMTPSEVKIARELAGLPTIDEHGHVTGEIVQITDSYQYLSASRKEEIINLEHELITEFRDVLQEAYSRHTKVLEDYYQLLDDIGHGLITQKEARDRHIKFCIDAREKKPLSKFYFEAKNLSYIEGYRDDILTPMELSILGRDYDNHFEEQPHTPLGIQKGDLSILDANRMRMEEGYFIANTDLFTGYEQPWGLTLEKLNDRGQTEKGPELLGHETLSPLSAKHIDYFKERFQKILFSRPGDIYHPKK